MRENRLYLTPDIQLATEELQVRGFTHISFMRSRPTSLNPERRIVKTSDGYACVELGSDEANRALKRFFAHYADEESEEKVPTAASVG